MELKNVDVSETKDSAEWRRMLVAAFAAGAAFLLVDIIGRALFQPQSTWATPRRIAALLIPEHVGSIESLDIGTVAVALLIHTMLSLIYARMLFAIVRRMPVLRAVAAGGIFAFIVYLVNEYVLTSGPLFRSFIVLRGPIALLAHVAFGITAAAVYTALTAPHRRRTAML